MFGNLIPNRNLKQLKEAGLLVLENFDERMLKAAHYTVYPGRVLKRNDEGKWLVNHDFHADGKFVLEPNEYVLVELRDRIKIVAEGIVGRIVTSSSHIEAGLGIIAGQIDPQYGTHGEYIRVGLKNLLAVKNQIEPKTRLVHIEFFDLRGLVMDSRELQEVEKKVWMQRRRDQEEDGPKYPDG